MYQPTITSSAEQDEGHSPTPGEEIRFGLNRSHDRKHRRGEQVAGRYARLRPARPEAAPRRVSVLRGHQHGSSPLPTDGEALDKPQDDQCDRRPNADLCVGRKKPDEHCSDAHQDEAQHKQALAADAVAEMAEDDPSTGRATKPSA
jgi:hypothetical protein